jgi:hypothetical protein
MRRLPILSFCLAAAVSVAFAMTAPSVAQQSQTPAPPAAAPGPYKPVAISAPAPIQDASFEAFRKQLAAIAQRKDRNALARLVAAQGFFWDGDQGDKADKRRSGIDNLSLVLNLAAKDGSGWETLAAYVTDPTGSLSDNHENVICAPADPEFDDQAYEAMIKATGTEESDWAYAAQPGVQVRSGPQPNAPVIETLGAHFVRLLPDNPPVAPSADQEPPLRIVTPNGKVGYVPYESMSALGNDQLCYIKDAGGWKIAGFVGGGQ